jgi:hypothetical protein
MNPTKIFMNSCKPILQVFFKKMAQRNCKKLVLPNYFD